MFIVLNLYVIVFVRGYN